ncbi:MAG: hypothetical protein OEO79_11785 [Gemmatimonadota bacterium]|nr:hypothetical protein [Gemmatimonadota bacterium]MDH3422316.1 hypothetical protein [Gemmatimonadota bacterium]
MYLRFCAICEDARPTSDGKIDVHGVYHDLAAPGFPARQDMLVLVLVIEWSREDHGRYLFKADLEDEEGKASVTVEGETEVHQPSPDLPPARSQLIMPLENVVFPHAGQYQFRIRIKGQAFDGPSIYLMEAPEDESAT